MSEGSFSGPGPEPAFLPLRTERLELRGLTVRDAPALFAYRSLAQVSRYQGFSPKSLAEAEDFIARASGPLGRIDAWLQLGLFRDAVLIGDLGLHFLSPDTVELGYTLSPTWQGQGFAREAVRAVVDFLFGALGKRRIEANLDARNLPSRALLETLGFHGLSEIREGELAYVLEAGDWEGR